MRPQRQPGAAVGEVVFSSDDAVARANEGHKVILVRWETNPDDLKGMVAAEGILTSHGGKTSHAAVIARGMGTPCVCGVERFHIDAAEKVVRIEGSDRVLHEGDVISIDGTQASSSMALSIWSPPSSPATWTPSCPGRRDPSGRDLWPRQPCARQRRQSRGRRARARVWRRGHRPVPHRAHVSGRSQEHHPELHPVRR